MGAPGLQASLAGACDFSESHFLWNPLSQFYHNKWKSISNASQLLYPEEASVPVPAQDRVPLWGSPAAELEPQIGNCMLTSFQGGWDCGAGTRGTAVSMPFLSWLLARKQGYEDNCSPNSGHPKSSGPTPEPSPVLPRTEGGGKAEVRQEYWGLLLGPW